MRDSVSIIFWKSCVWAGLGAQTLLSFALEREFRGRSHSNMRISVGQQGSQRLGRGVKAAFRYNKCRACRTACRPQASYNKQGEESLRVDGKVTRLWKVFFKPASGYTDRLGVAIPIGNVLDEVFLERLTIWRKKCSFHLLWSRGIDLMQIAHQHDFGHLRYE